MAYHPFTGHASRMFQCAAELEDRPRHLSYPRTTESQRAPLTRWSSLHPPRTRTHTHTHTTHTLSHAHMHTCTHAQTVHTPTNAVRTPIEKRTHSHTFTHTHTHTYTYIQTHAVHAHKHTHSHKVAHRYEQRPEASKPETPSHTPRCVCVSHWSAVWQCVTQVTQTPGGS